jgi:hypothetical protein
MLAKYFEIAASRTVVAGKIPKKDRPLWRHHYVRLDESMADEEIIRRLKDALADKDELRRMADAMYEPVRTSFGYPQYRHKIASIIDAVHRDSLVQ